MKTCKANVKSYTGISEADFNAKANNLPQNSYSLTVWASKQNRANCRSKLTIITTKAVNLNAAITQALRLCGNAVNNLDITADAVTVTSDFDVKGIRALNIKTSTLLSYKYVSKLQFSQSDMPKASDGSHAYNLGESGQNGAHGQDGADGAVVNIKATEIIIGGGSLQIHTKGGNGGDGGHGSNGVGGANGNNGYQHPRYSREGQSSKLSSRRSWSCNGYQCTTCDDRIPQYNGGSGGSGGNGGNGGNGGAGGRSGSVSISASKIYGEVFVVNVRGKDGRVGNLGRGGKGGRGGTGSKGVESYSCVGGNVMHDIQCEAKKLTLFPKFTAMKS